ncbi:MAG TPA: XdhC family protein, partial [bacterium]|nr:XdhC family protein [bacterium]
KKSFSSLPIDEKSWIVIVTYGHRYDAVCLEEALITRARYIGMIGSRHKVRATLSILKKKGVGSDDKRIYSPIGLHLGNSTPGEISVSILAEILKLKSSGTGRHFRDID